MEKGSCFFCRKRHQPSYKEVEVLQKFVSDRAKILGRNKTGLCQKHQKRVAQTVKRARYLALLPFIARP